MAFYSPGSHPAKGNHSNSSRAESRRGAKRGEIVTRKVGAGEERLKNKINWRLVANLSPQVLTQITPSQNKSANRKVKALYR